MPLCSTASEHRLDHTNDRLPGREESFSDEPVGLGLPFQSLLNSLALA